MRTTQRLIAGVMVTANLAGITLLPMAAKASETGRRNTTYALGAAAAALLLTQKNKLPGLITLAGAAYAYKRYNDSIVQRHRLAAEYGYNYQGNRYNNHNNYRQQQYLQQERNVQQAQWREHEQNLQHDRYVQQERHQQQMREHEQHLQEIRYRQRMHWLQVHDHEHHI